MKLRIIILGLIIALLAVSSSSAQEFTVTTTAANTVSSKSTVERSELTGNPLAIIVATPLGNTEKLNPHPIGAWYYNGKWNIFNTDHAAMPLGAKYKVQVFPKPGPDQFLHVITRQNLGGEGSYLDSPSLNNNPNAQVTILQSHAPDNRAFSLNSGEAKAGYDPVAGKWYIANVNGRRLYPNTAYNVVVLPGNADGSTPQKPTPIPTRTREPIGQPVTQSLATAETTPCTNEGASQKVGSWGKQGIDDLANADSSFLKEQYKPVLANAQKVIELLKQANLQPIGIQGVANRSISGRSNNANGALPYGVRAMYMNYLCMPDTPDDPQRGQIVPNGETETKIEVFFNGLGWLTNLNRSLGKEITTVNGEIMFFFPKQTGELKGLTLLRPGLNNLPQRDEAVIISAGGRLPLKPVTREEYLLAWAKLSRKKIKQLQEGEQRSPNPTRQSIIKTEENELARIESAIAQMSAAESQMQAIIGDDWGSGGRFFAPESEIDSIRLVTIDRGFYDDSLPRQAIQLVVVYWSWNEKSAPKAEMVRQFKQNFDFESLRQMLGK